MLSVMLCMRRWTDWTSVGWLLYRVLEYDELAMSFSLFSQAMCNIFIYENSEYAT